MAPILFDYAATCSVWKCLRCQAAKLPSMFISKFEFLFLFYLIKFEFPITSNPFDRIQQELSSYGIATIPDKYNVCECIDMWHVPGSRSKQSIIWWNDTQSVTLFLHLRSTLPIFYIFGVEQNWSIIRHELNTHTHTHSRTSARTIKFYRLFFTCE